VFDRCRVLDSFEPWAHPRLAARSVRGKPTLEPGHPQRSSLLRPTTAPVTLAVDELRGLRGPADYR
jgi:hypothetical protein